MAKLTLDLHDIFNRGHAVEQELNNVIQEAIDKKIPIVEIILRDRALLATIVLWAVMALVVAYEVSLFGPGGVEAFLGTG